MKNNSIVCDTPETIDAFRLLSMRGRFKMELVGMKGRGRSMYSIVKALYGFKGNKQSVFNQYENMLREKGIIQ